MSTMLTFAHHASLQRNIIQQMVQDNPKGRPSAVEIVSGKDFKRLKKVIRRTDACIKR